MPHDYKNALRIALLLATLAACSDAVDGSPATPWELHEPAPELPATPPDPAPWRAEIYARRDALGFFQLTSSARGAASVSSTYRLLELRIVFTSELPPELDVWVEGDGITLQRATSWRRPRPDALDVTIPDTDRLMWVKFIITEK